ncbi:ABC transporter related [Vibrio nigripulchritudo MADA3029]|uniref:ATP-binding cassette domain-containing protein n=1 Tax=Vibrio nigripulchritudo TaxID=28173 RepID=UPI0003B1ACAB|nr:ATP-binding cassette domain-containing protein [Vibrio nigripulchritudo]CCN47704.1 ABC transporter related [Vibrio nigripulchritudo MADA3020]CCN56083.1 ABC transporter related [Vibrio nigripulchritudo MADA3021]CCN58881.1 ABC transporter related [Vibrio nigripulchritudo MADA3029]
MNVSTAVNTPVSEPLLVLNEVSKTFGGTVAVKDVTFDIRPGEVLALLGENGAGKSTCVKLMVGVYAPNSGQISLKGQFHKWKSPLDAQNAGIAVIHQHPGLFPDLSITENIFFGRFKKTKSGLLDVSAMRSAAIDALEAVGLDAKPEQLVKTLSVSEQQLVEIARALSTNADVLIMDEPTAALSYKEVRKLFRVVTTLKSRGVGIVFVGHRMDEIFEVSDRVAILRDGQLVGLDSAENLTRQKVVNLMAGRELTASYPKREHELGDAILQVDDLSLDGQYSDVTFSVHKGEILGIGGLVGSGRTEIARTIFGIERPTSGQVLIDGQAVSLHSPKQAMANGIAYVSEDRLSQSLIMDFSIRVNGSLTVLNQCTSMGLLQPKQEIGSVLKHLEHLKLRYASFDQEISGLSGGNQQKVVLAKWLATQPRILILDEPTQGIDVQSKVAVHHMIADLAKAGMSIVLISSEMPELLGMCDRITVMREGCQVETFDRNDATQEKILAAATSEESNELKTPTKVGDETESAQSFWQRLLAQREIGLVLAILAIVLPVSYLNPSMLSSTNLVSLGMDAALLSIVVLGQMMVILTRNIDLSVASVIGFTAYTAAYVMSAYPDISVFVAIAVAVFMGGAAGFVNGTIIAYGRVPSIVATLGTMSVFRGLHSIFADGDQISADEVPARWLDVVATKIGGIPMLIIVSICILVVFSLILRRTQWGRELYGVGSNPDGADLVGVPAPNRVFAVFVIAGALAGLMGALWASRYATVDARVAFGFELTVIASVVVGGVAIRGGSGTVLGVFLGAVTLLVIRNGLTLVRIDPLWLQGIYGLVILVAIFIDSKVANRTTKNLGRRALS